jgi:hypothetical protein
MRRTAPVLAMMAATALGGAILTSDSAAAGDGRRAFSVGTYSGMGRPWRHHHHHHRWNFTGGWGFEPYGSYYGGPTYVGSYGTPGCYYVARRTFVPGIGFVRKSFRVCDGAPVF